MAYQDVILAEPGLISYWRLGESSGAALDSKDSNPGTTVTGITRNNGGLIAGNADGAIRSPGTTGAYIRIPFNANMNVGAQLSVEFWILATSLGSGGTTPIGRRALGDTWRVSYDSQGRWTAVVYDANGVANTITTPGAPGDVAGPGVIRHVVMTYNAAGVFKLYIDGADVGSPRTPNASVISTSSPIDLCSGYDQTTFPSVNGILDEVALYNVALTPGQVQHHCNVGNGVVSTEMAVPPARAQAAAPAPSLPSAVAAYKDIILAEPSLVSYWRLNESSGNALDSYGTNPGTTIVGITRGVPGLLALDSDKAAASNGTPGNEITVPYSNSLQGGGAFTVECWVKATVIPGGDSAVVVSLGSPTTPFWRLRVFQGIWQADVRDTANNVTTAYSSVAATPATSHHLVLVYDYPGYLGSPNMYLYVDGVASTGNRRPSAPVMSDGSSPLVMFADVSAPAAAGFNGVVDEVAFYTSPFAAAQVQAHYSAGAGEIVAVTPPTAAAPGYSAAASSSVSVHVPAA